MRGPDGQCVICRPDPTDERIKLELRITAALENRRRARAELAKRSLSEFFRQSWSVLEPGTQLLWNWHIDALCEHVQLVLEGWAAARKAVNAREAYEHIQKIRNLVINIPPRTLKSRIVSVAATAWAWLRWPDLKLICLSSIPGVATRDSGETRKLIESEWYQRSFQPAWTLTNVAETLIKNSAGGWRDAKGLNAKITGKGGDGIIVDDPHDAEEAESETKRESVIRRWNLSCENRVNDERIAFRIGIMQRVHEADWTNFVLQQGWHHLCLPLEHVPDRTCECVKLGAASCNIATKHASTSPIGWSDPRDVEGAILQAERFTETVIAKAKKKGAFYFAGQFQQVPAPDEGGMFKRLHWRFYKSDTGTSRPHRCINSDKAPAAELPAKFDMIMLSVDAQFKETGTSRTSITGYGIKGAKRYALDHVVKKMDLPMTITAIDAMRGRLQKRFKQRSRKILVEDKANGSAIITILSKRVTGVITIKPEGGKVSRAGAMQPTVEQGNYYLPEGAAWAVDWVHEYAVFPNGQYDDQVDDGSQLEIYLAGSVKGLHAAKLL